MKACAALTVLLAIAGVAVALPADLTPSWTIKLPFGPPTEFAPVTALGGSMFFAVDSNGTVWATNITSRKIKWSLRWDDITGLVPYPDQDILIVQVSEGTWAMRASTGALVWVNNTIQPEIFATGGQWFAGIVANGDEMATTNCYDVLTGNLMWSNPITSAPLFVSNDRVLIQNGSIVMGLDARTGKVAWQGNYQSGMIAASNGLVVAANPTNQNSFTLSIFVLDAVTGAVKSSIPTSFGEFSSLSAVFGDNGDIVVSDLFNTLLLIKGDTLTLAWTQSLPSSASGFSNFQAIIVGSLQVFMAGSGMGASDTFNTTAFNRTNGALSFTIVQPPGLFNNNVLLGGMTLIGDSVLFPNLIGYILFSQKTGLITAKSYTEMLPFVAGTQKFLDAKRFVAQDMDGSVSGYNF